MSPDPLSARSVWGVYDNRDYYVSTLEDNKLYASKEQAEAVCDALNKAEGYGFSVEEHLLEEPVPVATQCVCPPVGYAPSCPWVRGEVDGEVIGHVKTCPQSGSACPCLPGSLSHAYCSASLVQL